MSSVFQLCPRFSKWRYYAEHEDFGARYGIQPNMMYLIFDVILVLENGKKPLLPAEWESFKELFSNSELDFAMLSSYPCLWGHTKQLGFYVALDNWCNPSKSEKGVRDIVINSLSSMRIFKTNWVKRLDKDIHLLKFSISIESIQKRTLSELQVEKDISHLAGRTVPKNATCRRFREMVALFKRLQMHLGLEVLYALPFQNYLHNQIFCFCETSFGTLELILFSSPFPDFIKPVINRHLISLPKLQQEDANKAVLRVADEYNLMGNINNLSKEVYIIKT
ncbi:hypothetical protein POM88_007759 [Heracleum sosnowskyi]|uniref:Uncharacterized protein n=1 Tax=Heracleum sosnowskyi TaxID=360622 RepID=A0AAD8J655_9APIA|nr:hypothetical protein POM88_007759 [Heracleum sosnowskyi]